MVVREDNGEVPGTAALAELLRHTEADPKSYAFVAGESTLATEGVGTCTRRVCPSAASHSPASGSTDRSRPLPEYIEQNGALARGAGHLGDGADLSRVGFAPVRCR